MDAFWDAFFRLKLLDTTFIFVTFLSAAVFAWHKYEDDEIDQRLSYESGCKAWLARALSALVGVLMCIVMMCVLVYMPCYWLKLSQYKELILLTEGSLAAVSFLLLWSARALSEPKKHP
jgi:formate hydrogenlyase subunit 3/multisubunit Na+/H+ antiporter MnhD subunit